ncbi:MAG: aspartate-semialdehyde dehydrogenase [Bdellovibrionaceae bacterium]|jgi:aspartate-semialdehyde dehydrogenase|nr:aspartate-semialdehyde dehydrogenase [Pseudobdellovibrionaceae bacterium]
MIRKNLRIGLVGATGMVGETFIQLLNEEKVSVQELRPFASEKSLGQSITYENKQWPIQILKPDCFKGLDLVFFSSGDPISKEWAPEAEKSGAYAIDNSAAFRMSDNHLLVTPEVNGHLLAENPQPQVIANPNCSTIQLVVALNPLKKFGLKKVHVATYQAVSGGGKEAQNELTSQMKNLSENKKIQAPQDFPHQILFNCIPEIGGFDEQGFCSEEMKIINETKKILQLPKLQISAFTVRVPVLNGHSEAVWAEFEKDVTREDVLAAFREQEGLKVIDNPKNHAYPHVVEASGKNPVYVGRVHKDLNLPNTWIFWVVADNIRKGAALNGLQIAAKLF